MSDDKTGIIQTEPRSHRNAWRVHLSITVGDIIDIQVYDTDNGEPLTFQGMRGSFAKEMFGMARGVDQGRLWDDLLSVTAEKRKVVEARWRRLDKLDQYMLVSEFSAMLHSFMQKLAIILRRHTVPDEAVREIHETGLSVFAGHGATGRA